MNFVCMSRAAIVTIGALLFATTAAAQAERRQTLELTLADAGQRAGERHPTPAILPLGRAHPGSCDRPARYGGRGRARRRNARCVRAGIFDVVRTIAQRDAADEL